MLNSMINNLRCDFCEEGHLYYDPKETLDSYFIPHTFVLAEMDEIIDKTINEYLVFKCAMCKSTVKYTLRDIEKKIRDNMYEKLIKMILIKEFRDFNVLNSIDKTFIYCGKCPGFDGKGACPVKIFDECKLKRLPYL